MYDLHCHASFSADPHTFADALQASSLEILSATVTPDDYAQACGLFASSQHIHVAAGLHPWWVSPDVSLAQKATDSVIEQIETTSLVGEIGLDYSSAHVHSRQAQLTSLTRILEACAAQGGKTITLHSVRAATQLLDLVEQTDCTRRCTCIMHWFTGSSSELSRAIRLGMYFSVGERMLATKRGKAYVRAIPQGRLVLETDLPAQAAERSDDAHMADEQAKTECAQLQASLERALEAVLASGGPHTLASIETLSQTLLG